jgi:hypothetical protein
MPSGFLGFFAFYFNNDASTAFGHLGNLSAHLDHMVYIVYFFYLCMAFQGHCLSFDYIRVINYLCFYFADLAGLMFVGGKLT